MISVKEVEQLHAILIRNFGGSQEIRDLNGLESSLARPYQTFDGTELYPTSIEKGAAICESILINHPFVDGNKRTGYVLMRMILMRNKLDIHASQEDKYELIIGVAEGRLKYDDILAWLKEKVR